MPLESKEPTPTLHRILQDHIEGKRSDIAAGKKKAKQIVEKIAKEVAIEKMVAYLKESLKLMYQNLGSKSQLNQELEHLEFLLEKYRKNESKVARLEEEAQEKELVIVPEYRRVKDKSEQIRNEIYSISAAICNADFDLGASWFEAVDKLCTADIPGTDCQTSILHRPIKTGIETPADPLEKERKLFLKDQLSKTLEDYLYSKPKEGGGNGSGEFGAQYICCYETAAGEVEVQRLLIKQDHYNQEARPEKDMIEYLSGRVMNALVGGRAATINLVTVPEGWSQSNSLSKRTYVASVYFGGGFDELYKFLYKKYGMVPKKSRPKGVGIWGTFTRLFKEFMLEMAEKPEIVKGFNETFAARLLIGDFDCHSGNVAIMNRNEFCAFDFGGVKLLTDDVHMHSHTRHMLVGWEPTNHFREYPRATKINLNFAAELERQAQVDLSPTINQSFAELSRHDVMSIQKMANRLGFKLYKVSKEALIAEFKESYNKKISARQLSLKKLALEIRLSCYAGERSELDKLKELISNNPSYFLNEDFHFRHKKQLCKIFPGVNVTKCDWRRWGSKGRELLNQINETLQKDTGIDIDLKIKDMVLRAEVYMARLQILADFISDQNEKKKMHAQAKFLKEWFEKYKLEKYKLGLSGYVVANDEVKASESNVILLCDEAYCTLRKNYQSLQASLEGTEKQKLIQRMEISHRFDDLDKLSDQQRYAEAFKRIALTGEIELDAKKKEKETDNTKQTPTYDYVYKGPAFFNHDDTVARQRDEALLAVMVGTTALLDTLSSLIVALTALQAALAQQYSIKPVPASVVPALRS